MVLGCIADSSILLTSVFFNDLNNGYWNIYIPSTVADCGICAQMCWVGDLRATRVALHSSDVSVVGSWRLWGRWVVLEFGSPPIVSIS